VPIGFWSQLWKGAELHYTLIEKQLAAMYAALIAKRPLVGKQEVKVWTKDHSRMGTILVKVSQDGSNSKSLKTKVALSFSGQE
jgi:hypothetical protein